MNRNNMHTGCDAGSVVGFLVGCLVFHMCKHARRDERNIVGSPQVNDSVQLLFTESKSDNIAQWLVKYERESE